MIPIIIWVDSKVVTITIKMGQDNWDDTPGISEVLGQHVTLAISEIN